MKTLSKCKLILLIANDLVLCCKILVYILGGQFFTITNNSFLMTNTVKGCLYKFLGLVINWSSGISRFLLALWDSPFSGDPQGSLFFNWSSYIHIFHYPQGPLILIDPQDSHFQLILRDPLVVNWSSGIHSCLLIPLDPFVSMGPKGSHFSNVTNWS
jgi:hypothetical protein